MYNVHCHCHCHCTLSLSLSLSLSLFIVHCTLFINKEATVAVAQKSEVVI